MDRIATLRLFADYNHWMNHRLYEAAARLPAAELAADRGAFFKSLIGTLNHIAVGDTVWLQRFARHPAAYAALDPVRALPTPTSLDQILFCDLAALAGYREMLDETIIAFTAAITEPDLDHALEYASMKGAVSTRNFYGLLLHLFNHQTHHRGQATPLLTQAGADMGPTDLVLRIPPEPAV